MVVKAELIRNYWHVRLPVSRRGIIKYRIHDVGRPHSNQRLAGMTRRGGWKTLSWRVHKENVRIRGTTLTALNERTAKILQKIRQQYGAIKVV